MLLWCHGVVTWCCGEVTWCCGEVTCCCGDVTCCHGIMVFAYRMYGLYERSSIVVRAAPVVHISSLRKQSEHCVQVAGRASLVQTLKLVGFSVRGYVCPRVITPRARSAPPSCVPRGPPRARFLILSRKFCPPTLFSHRYIDLILCIFHWFCCFYYDYLSTAVVGANRIIVILQ